GGGDVALGPWPGHVDGVGRLVARVAGGDDQPPVVEVPGREGDEVRHRPVVLVQPDGGGDAAGQVEGARPADVDAGAPVAEPVGGQGAGDVVVGHERHVPQLAGGAPPH